MKIAHLCSYFPTIAPLFLFPSSCRDVRAFRIFKVYLEESFSDVERKRKILKIVKIAFIASVSIVEGCLFLQGKKVFHASILLFTIMAVVAVAVHQFILRKKFHHLSIEREVDSWTLWNQDHLLRNIIKVGFSEKPIERFKLFALLSGVSKRFCLLFREAQVGVLEGNFDYDSDLFIPKYENLLEFAKRYSVNKLYLRNLLSDPLCQGLVTAVPDLTHLRIASEISEKGLNILASSLRRLKHIEVRLGTGSIDFQALASLKQLEYLEVRGDRVKNLQFLGTLSHLKSLILYKICLPTLFQEVVKCTKLVQLTLIPIDNDDLATPCIDQGLEMIKQNLTHLQSLHLDGYTIYQKGLEAICKITSLRELAIFSESVVCQQWMSLSYLKNLVSLEIRYGGLNNKGLQIIGKYLTQLKSCKLHKLPVRDKDLDPLKNLTKLEELAISECEKVVGTCLPVFAFHLKRLSFLEMESASPIIKRGFSGLLQFKSLKSLSLDASEWIMPRHLEKIGLHLPTLQELSVQECPNLEPYFIDLFRQKHQNMKVHFLEGSSIGSPQVSCHKMEEINGWIQL